MSVAKDFLEKLQQGKLDEAIETIQTGLRESTVQKIEESRQEILESYGFRLDEKKDKTYEEDDDSDDGEEDDDDNMDEKGDYKNKKDDE